MLRKIMLFSCLLLNLTFFAQQNNEAQIDSISIKLIYCFQEDDLSTLDFHFVIKQDLVYLIDSMKDIMSEEEIERARSEIDSIPKSAKRKWLRKFNNARNEAGEYILDWTKITYLSSTVEIKIDEFVMREVAKVSAKFEFAEKAFFINYDCVKMPRGWVLGNRLFFEVNEEEND